VDIQARVSGQAMMFFGSREEREKSRRQKLLFFATFASFARIYTTAIYFHGLRPSRGIFKLKIEVR
jgi:hypothetical protein